MANPKLQQRRQELFNKVPKMDLEARDAVSNTAYNTGYAQCLRRKMKEGNAGYDAYRECREEANLKEQYKQEWGTGGPSS